MKKLLAVLLSLMMLLPLFTAQAEDALTVTVVCAESLGDRSFYDSANEGLQRLVADCGVIGKVIECKNDGSLFESSLFDAAENSDVVVAVGWQFYDALSLEDGVVASYPDVKFIFIDNEAGAAFDNLMNIVYAQNEGSFLAGYIAAQLSQTGKIGAVGGDDGQTIMDFIVGYKAGAEYGATVGEHPYTAIEVQTQFTNDYDDPAKGKECAKALYANGCDIVFQIAGKAGEGVFVAAAEKGCLAIGVDGDQKFINPDVIICSMVKEVGSSIYAVVSDLENVFQGGMTLYANMESGHIGVVYGTPDMTQQVSDELKAEVEALKIKIISGEIEVPTAF